MKKRYFFLLLIITAIHYSCNAGNKENSNTTDIIQPQLVTNDSLPPSEWSFDSLSVEKKLHIDNDTSKFGVSIDVFMRFPISVPANASLEKIQKTFAMVFDGKESRALTPKESFDEVLKKTTADAQDYLKDFDSEYPSYADYDINMGNSIDYISQDIIVTSVGYYTYTGGAHGNYNIQHYNIDIHNGDIVTEKLLFKDNYKEKLASLIQSKVNDMNSSPDESEHISLLVEINEIQPNDNFYFSNDGLVYVYNQYEISPYAQGIPEILLPYNEVAPIIKEQYQYILKNITKE